MFASLNLSSQIFASAAAGYLKAGVNQMGHTAGLVSRYAASIFQSQTIFVMRSSIDWSRLATLGVYGFVVGAVIAIISRIFRLEPDDNFRMTLVIAGDEALRNV